MDMKMFIVVFVLVVGAFGLWGNVNILVATIRKKDFQSKCGILIAILACGDTLCIGFVWHNALRSIIPDATYRTACFWTMSPYLFALNFQSCFMFMIACDRLLAIYIPIKYRVMSTRLYILYCAVPGILFGSATVIFSALMLEEGEIRICNPSFVLPDIVNVVNNRFGLVMSTLTLCMYVGSIVMLHVKRKQMRKRSERGLEYSHLMQQQKVMRTITLVVVVFLCSWFYAHLSVFVALSFDISNGFLDFAKQTVTIPAIVCYTTNYYIYLWRSRDYRKAFLEHIMFLRACGKISKINVFRISAHQSTSESYCGPTIPQTGSNNTARTK
ncbi:hypothetical protein L596_023339 [Steinernema carpocapsae]|uniref:G-protein coupled receptors family 1 profile domain-containing protein n=1 Tax=Steinernema carpocapsae TaxID=34508 RepID=A0A4U5MDC1_STECR|nr:hypothetical protein L596_023339 [Steinernema carpocapsae]